LQDFGDCSQSSQIGPHLVQPFRTRPTAITPKTIANRLTIAYLTRYASSYRINPDVFKPALPGAWSRPGERGFRRDRYLIAPETPPIVAECDRVIVDSMLSGGNGEHAIQAGRGGIRSR
jgi:hypothetical protein